MSTELQNVANTSKERKPAEPALPAAEQTRFSWARLIGSRDELPPAYRSFFEARPAGEAFPYAVLTPTFAGFLRRETEKLICCLDDHLIILEKTSGEPKCTAFLLSDLNYVEMGSVLLKAWIKFQGRANNETARTTVTLRYNAVTDWLFAPFIDRIRGTDTHSIDALRGVELDQLDDFDWPSFKYRNYARHSIRPGDRVIDAVGQPEIRRPVIRLGRWTYWRTIAMAQTLILTDHELIIIHDDPDSPESFDKTRYGGVWNYIPLNKIERIVWRAKDADLLAVSLELPFDDRVERLFAADLRVEVERFLTALSEWAPEAALQRA